MNRITWLIEQFQFTYRQLSDLLLVPPSIVHRFHNDKRKLPARNQGLLDHPLFAPYPIREEMAHLIEPKWEDPDKEIRILETETRWNVLFLERRKVANQLDSMKERRLTLHRILYHTRNLPFTHKGGESLIELKWIVLKSETREELESLTVEDRRKLEKKIAIIDAEMQLLQQWLDEDKGPDLLVHRIPKGSTNLE
jgi:hypothetical protein